MKTRKIPLRKCLISNERYPKKELLRIVRTPEGQVVIDQSGKQNGRGAYLKPTIENLEKLRKGKALQRALECEISEELFKEIAQFIEKTERR